MRNTLTDWQLGSVGFGRASEGPSLGFGWMHKQGFALWLWRYVFVIGQWSNHDD